MALALTFAHTDILAYYLKKKKIPLNWLSLNTHPTLVKTTVLKLTEKKKFKEQDIAFSPL